MREMNKSRKSAMKGAKKAKMKWSVNFGSEGGDEAENSREISNDKDEGTPTSDNVGKLKIQTSGDNFQDAQEGNQISSLGGAVKTATWAKRFSSWRRSSHLWAAPSRMTQVEIDHEETPVPGMLGDNYFVWLRDSVTGEVNTDIKIHVKWGCTIILPWKTWKEGDHHAL